MHAKLLVDYRGQENLQKEQEHIYYSTPTLFHAEEGLLSSVKGSRGGADDGGGAEELINIFPSIKRGDTREEGEAEVNVYSSKCKITAIKYKCIIKNLSCIYVHDCKRETERGAVDLN